MNRRDFFRLSAVVTVAAPWAASAAFAELASYTPKALAAALAEGKTVFLDFKASWCSTCKSQERMIEALKAENPAYSKNITFMTVDWDQWMDGDLVKELNIPRRSTLVVLKGDQELGRVVAGTGRAEIKALMDTALSASA